MMSVSMEKVFIPFHFFDRIGLQTGCRTMNRKCLRKHGMGAVERVLSLGYEISRAGILKTTSMMVQVERGKT